MRYHGNRIYNVVYSVDGITYSLKYKSKKRYYIDKKLGRLDSFFKENGINSFAGLLDRLLEQKPLYK